MTIFLPGFTKIDGPKKGNKYRETDAPFRLVLHTTETSGNVRATAETHKNPPHLWVDPKTRERFQTISLDRSAYALSHPSGKVETNHMHAIQIEIVGFAS